MYQSPTVKIHNNGPFPKMRAAYLRAIAKVWSEEARTSPSPPELRLKKALIEASCKGASHSVLEILAGNLSGTGEAQFGDPWKALDFPFFLTNLAFLNDGSDFQHRPTWAPNKNVPGWMGHDWLWQSETQQGDYIIVNLPERPAEKSDYMSALAMYTYWFPTILGRPGKWTVRTDGHFFEPSDMQPPAVFAETSLYIIEALARSWADQDFATGLFQREDRRSWFEEQMGCVIPWLFQLYFVKAGVPDSAAASNPHDSYWQNFPQTTFVLGFPQMPAQDATYPAIETIALARYNATGGEYPYTCI